MITSNRLDSSTYEAIVRQAREERARYLAALYSNWVSVLRQHSVGWSLFVSKLSRRTRPAHQATGVDAAC